MFDFFKKKSVETVSDSSLVLVTPTGTKVTNSKKDVYVGRNSAECDIVVENKNASNKHVHFMFRDGKWIVEDLNSTNGTWINGEKILPMHPLVLNSGDRICIALSAVFYFNEKPAEDKYIEDVDYEKSIDEIEFIISSIKKENSGHAMESKYFGRLIDLLCETSLFVRATIDNNKPENERFQVVLFKPAQDEIIPVFTRKCHADGFGNYGEVFKLTPERFMVVFKQLGEHIVINPNAENRLIIPKDIFQMIIFEEFVKKYNAKTSLKKYKENNDVFAALVCEYNIATNQADKMKLIATILEYMQENVAWVPCNVNYSKEDYEKLINLKKGEVFSFENTKLKPDILKHTSGKLFFPLFSQKEEAPDDYANNFSWVNIPIVQVCIMAKNNKESSGIIVNAFTNSLPITNELIDIILNRHFGKTNLINNEQMTQAVKEPNGGLQLELDNERLYFIRVFIENDVIIGYSIDKEAASDSHYTLEPYSAYQLSQLLEQEYHKGNLVDNLKQYFVEKSDYQLVSLMNENKINFQ